MKEWKQTLKFLHHTLKKVSYTVLGIAVLVDLIELFIKMQLQQANKSSQIIFCLYDNHLVLNIGLIAVIGWLSGNQVFTGYMEIMAKRKAYLTGVMGYGVMVSLIGAVLNRIVDCVVGFVAIEQLGLKGRYFGGVSFKDEVMIYLVVMSLGLLIGAAYYRLRKRSFGAVILIIGYMILSRLLNGSALGIELGEIKWMFQPSSSLGEIARIGVVAGFITGSILMLRKAPIKAYAHDCL